MSDTNLFIIRDGEGKVSSNGGTLIQHTLDGSMMTFDQLGCLLYDSSWSVSR